MRPIAAKDLGFLLPTNSGKPPRAARGERIAPKMNGLESAYAAQLAIEQQRGLVLWWRFEGITLKLAPDTRYTPDFAVMAADGALEAHETKGFMRDDARVKLATAAVMFPFRFYLVRRESGGSFTREPFTP